MRVLSGAVYMCKVSGVEVWCEVDMMTDGLTEVNCKLLQSDLTVPRTRLVRYGQRSFAVSGPTTWNTLPQSIRNLSCSFATFGKKLKTELFHRAYGTSIALS